MNQLTYISLPKETIGTLDQQLKNNHSRDLPYKFIWGTEKHSLLLLEPKMLRCVRKDHYAPYAIDYFVYSKHGQTNAYYTDKMSQELQQYGQHYLNPEFVRTLKADYHNHTHDFGLFLERLWGLDYPSMTNHELDDLYEQYFQFLIDTYTFFSLTFGWKLGACSQQLNELLAAHYPDEKERQEVLILLTSPEDFDEVSSEHVAWLNILGQKDQSTQLKNDDIITHVRRFPWLVWNTYNLEEITDFFQIKYTESSLSQAEIQAAIQHIHEEKAALHQQQKAIYEALDNPQIKYLADLLKWAAQERLYLKRYWAGCEFLTLKMLKTIAQRINCPFKTFIHSYKRADIKRSLIQGQALDEDEIQRRLTCVAYMVSEQQLFFYSGDEALNFIESLPIEAIADEQILTGTVAYPGAASGPVKIIKVDDVKGLQQDFLRFKQGDVLVTTMTQPNILMLMNKASAVLTDEGGITCHAAIICRELKIPCIVGLHTATRVLKEDEWVTIDTHAGTVHRGQEPKHKNTPTSAAQNNPERVTHNGAAHSVKPVIPQISLHESVVRLKDLNLKHSNSAGGKAANLGELANQFNVPDGFCITAKAYTEFITSNELQNHINDALENLEYDDIEAVEQCSQKLMALFQKVHFPQALKQQIEACYAQLENAFVAVRSSAIAEDSADATFAGQHDTFLNVKGPEAVIDAICQCWASIYSARALMYRHAKQESNPDWRMSVVVQEMVEPDYSGVMFTQHPLQPDRLLIEVIEGLGEALVSGLKSPNRYTIDQLNTITTEEGRYFDLSPKLLLQVNALGKAVETHYDTPMDIEFVIQEDRVYLLQARHVTA